MYGPNICRDIYEKYFVKSKHVFWAFMDIEKAYDKIDRKGICSVLRLYGLSGRLLKGMQSFYA